MADEGRVSSCELKVTHGPTGKAEWFCTCGWAPDMYAGAPIQQWYDHVSAPASTSSGKNP